jgi:hypothetical protein
VLFRLPPRIRAVTYIRAEIAKKGQFEGGTEDRRADWSTQGDQNATEHRDRVTAETGEQVPARPHDSGSAANETVDGLDATTEAIRHAAEDTPTGTDTGKIEKIPVLTGPI